MTELALVELMKSETLVVLILLSINRGHCGLSPRSCGLYNRDPCGSGHCNHGHRDCGLYDKSIAAEAIATVVITTEAIVAEVILTVVITTEAIVAEVIATVF